MTVFETVRGLSFLSVFRLDLASEGVGDNEREDHEGLDKNETDDHRREDLACC